MPVLLAWMHRNSAGLYLSVITVAEVEDGIAKSRRLGARRKGRAAIGMARDAPTPIRLASAPDRLGNGAAHRHPFGPCARPRSGARFGGPGDRRHGAEERLYHPDPQSAAFRFFGSSGARPARNAADYGPVTSRAPRADLPTPPTPHPSQSRSPATCPRTGKAYAGPASRARRLPRLPGLRPYLRSARSQGVAAGS
jgi:hypothetical protein